MTYNLQPGFVGIAGLKERHRRQLDAFESWAQQGRWAEFHHSHYDWWAFPIDASSLGQGYIYTVYEGEVEVLRQDTTFIRDLDRGAELVAASWGWDMKACAYVTHPTPDQCWHHWPVRLSKAARSMRLFGLTASFESLKTYALILIGQGEDMTYNGHDVSWPFTDDGV